jgi:hypothetical protein
VRLDHLRGHPADAAPGRRRHRQRLLVRRQVAPPREGLRGVESGDERVQRRTLERSRRLEYPRRIVNPGPIDTEIWEKEDEPPSYNGPKYPPSIVVDAIFEVIEKRRYEVTIPRRHPMLITARFLRLFLPGVLRFGMGKTEPVQPEIIDKARERAGQGKRLGEG